MSSPGTSDVDGQSDQFKDGQRQEWAAAAAGWRKWDAELEQFSAPLTDLLLVAAQLAPGMQVLDTGSGTGDPALALAVAVGPTGEVTATDLVPEMLAVAEEKARTRGLANLRVQVADAESLPFPDGAFDVVTGRLSLMLCPTPERALQEAYRVLRPGGRAVYLVWGPVEQNAYFASVMGPFAKRGLLPAPPPGAPGPFRFAPAGTLEAALHGQGFAQVSEAPHRVVLPWPTPVDRWLESVPELGPTFQRVLASVPLAQRGDILREVRTAAETYRAGQQIHFPVVAIVGSGTR
jgi:SAM-dependent methyltransferase